MATRTYEISCKVQVKSVATSSWVKSDLETAVREAVGDRAEQITISEPVMVPREVA